MSIQYITVFIFLLVAIFKAMTQMSIALEEWDIEKFVIWTGIASVIACLPMSF
jgi:PhoPQ-activated pathogenicity-related protein